MVPCNNSLERTGPAGICKAQGLAWRYEVVQLHTIAKRGIISPLSVSLIAWERTARYWRGRLGKGVTDATRKYADE